MARQDVTSVYRSVIDDVVARVKGDFVEEGVDEAVLDELRELWEEKLLASGVLDAAQPAAPLPGFLAHAQQVAHSVPQTLGQPTYQPQNAYAAYTPPVQPAVQQYLQQYGTTAAAGGPSNLGNQMSFTQLVNSAGTKQEASYHPSTGAVGSSPDRLGDLDSRKRKLENWQENTPGYKHPHGQGTGYVHQPAAGPSSGVIPQQDGNDDDDEEEEEEEEEAVGEEGAGDAGVREEDDEDRLSGLSEDSAEEAETDNVVLAQFENVKRTKNRWKCALKNGIMHINGRDVLFKKATGEMEF